MINHLCHMGGRYLVTMIPERMEMYWGSVLMCATYMAMFWGKTNWLVVCMWCVAWVGEPWIPSGDAGFILDPGVEWARLVRDQLARESHCGLNHIETDPPSSSSPLIHHNIHVNIHIAAISYGWRTNSSVWSVHIVAMPYGWLTHSSVWYMNYYTFVCMTYKIITHTDDYWSIWHH